MSDAPPPPPPPPHRRRAAPRTPRRRPPAPPSPRGTLLAPAALLLGLAACIHAGPGPAPSTAAEPASTAAPSAAAAPASGDPARPNAPPPPYRLDLAGEEWYDGRGWAEQTLAALTLEEKVSQLMMPILIGDYAPEGTSAGRRARALVEDHQVGGIIISVGSPTEVAAKLNWLQSLSSLPLLIGSDLEAGAGFRFDGVVHAPTNIWLGGATRFPRSWRSAPRAIPAWPTRWARHRARGAGDRGPRALRAGARRQQQPREPRHQRALVRRGPRAGRRAGRRIRQGNAGPRRDRHRQALSRPRRHRRRFAPRPAGHPGQPRAHGLGRAAAVPPRGRGGARGGHDRAHHGARDHRRARPRHPSRPRC